MKKDAIIDHIVEWLGDYARKAGMHGFVIGVSGGIDSAVSSTLCARTGLRVVTLELPIHQAREQMQRGREHVQWLQERFPNVTILETDLTESYDLFVRAMERTTDLNRDVDRKFLTLSNTRSRLRMTALYAVAGLENLLVCGTGNKVEDFGVGFYTKYGDGGVDLSPIADLMKSEVYALGQEMGIISSILEARPTDGLWDDGRTDEDQIGATYDELEWAMRLHEAEGDNPAEHHFTSERQREVWNIYRARHRANLHKMQPIPVCVIPDALRN